MRAIIGGLIGGAIGAAIWAIAVNVSGYEYGWIAWGIGGLVGYGVAVGNKDGGRTPTAAGIIAVAISAVSIMAGKYIGIEMMMPSDEELVDMFVSGFEEEEYVVSFVADEVVAEHEEAGRTLDWPEGMEAGMGSAAADYPEEVWAEAEARWLTMSETERDDFTSARRAQARADIEESLPEIRAMIAGDGFMGSFGPMDLIFFGLAMTTAFGLGSGGKKTAEELAAEFAEAVQLAMIEVMVADGEVDEEEVRTVTEVYREMTGVELSADVIRAKATLAQSRGKDLNAELAELAPHLSDEGKATALRAAVKVAVADGEFEAAEQAVLSGVAEALGMTPEQMRETVAGLTQPA